VNDNEVAVAAVDLGASSGRVFLFTLSDGRIVFEPVARFSNGGVFEGERFVWDIRRLYDEIVVGLATATKRARETKSELRSVGVDSWAVDYGIFNKDGDLVANPMHHRDVRTNDSYKVATDRVAPWDLYQRNGIAMLPFNTLFQLIADGDVLHEDGVKILLVPDLIDYFLSAKMAWEITNASTTSMLALRRDWDGELLARFDIPLSLVGPLSQPGNVLGTVSDPAALEKGVSSELEVIVVASHDTASAVLAVPASDQHFAYISSGTWSLVGVELDEPLISEDAFASGYTNELGAFGKTRFLRNVMGFWLLQEVIREYALEGTELDAATLTASALELPVLRYLVDAQSEELLAPGDMRGRLARQSEQLGFEVPATPAQFTRCILDSLALAYRTAIRGIVATTGKRVDVLHIVGGGAMNEALCQLTANACEIPVVAGPVEGAAIGNALVQFQALGVVASDIWTMRKLVADSFATKRYEPSIHQADQWVQAEALLREHQL
jgi:rhamnulokinase